MSDEKDIIILRVDDPENPIQPTQTKMYKSCCFSIDKNSTIFFSTLTISLICLIFSLYKLTLDLKCEESNTYMSLVTFILGIYIKSPMF